MTIELPAGWSTKKIRGEKSFDDLFQIEGIPLSWFYQRLLLPHVVPKPINTFPQLSRKERLTMVQKVKLMVTARLLARYLYYNERRKCSVLFRRKGSLSKRPPSASSRKALFLSYLDHYQDGHLYRLQGIIDALREGKILEPYVVLADKLSSRKMVRDQGNGLNTIYRHVNERLSQLAWYQAAALHQQWKKLDCRSRERLLGNSFGNSPSNSHDRSTLDRPVLWPYFQYAFSFYMSREFLYLTHLYYHTMKEIIEQQNIAIVITTAQNSLFERCCFAAAKNKGIPALFIQHGLGTLARPAENFLDNTHLAVFGPYTQQLLLSAGMRPEQVIITGPVVYDEIVSLLPQSSDQQPYSRDRSKSRNSMLIITQPLVEDLLMSKPEYFTAVKKVVRACLSLPFPIHIKLHPRETNFSAYEKIIESASRELLEKREQQDQKITAIKIYRHQSSEQLYRLLAQAALMINFRFSAAMVEAAILKVPIVTIPLCPGQPTYFKDLDPSIHLRVDQDESDLAVKIKEIIAHPESSNGKREEVILKFFGKIDGQSSQRAADLIVRLSKSPSPDREF